jgi:hypothetical protein
MGDEMKRNQTNMQEMARLPGRRFVTASRVVRSRKKKRHLHASSDGMGWDFQASSKLDGAIVIVFLNSRR